MLRTKRIYEVPSPDDGYRILVDRLWPRGVKKERAKLDLWAREVAPSAKVRTDFHHDPALFPHFRTEYLEELSHNPAVLNLTEAIKGQQKDRNVTLLYAAKDTVHNQAVVLKDFLEQRLNGSK